MKIALLKVEIISSHEFSVFVKAFIKMLFQTKAVSSWDRFS